MRKALLVGGRGQKNVRLIAKLNGLGIDIVKTWSADQVRGGSVPMVDAVLVLSEVVGHRHVDYVQKHAKKIGVPVVCISKGMARTKGILKINGLLDEVAVEVDKLSNKGKTYRKWTDEEIDLMGRLRAAGKTWREIAESLDGEVNKDTIRGVYNSRKMNRSVDKFAERAVGEGRKIAKKDPKREDADWITLLESENERLSAEVEGAGAVRKDLLDRLRLIEARADNLERLAEIAEAELRAAEHEKKEAFLRGVRVADRLVSGGMTDELSELVSMLKDTSGDNGSDSD